MKLVSVSFETGLKGTCGDLTALLETRRNCAMIASGERALSAIVD